jgi:hypothetical protein
MRGTSLTRVPVALAALIAIAALVAAPAALARTLVDPTSLTPPLKPFRICYELGPYVQCDTSGDTFTENAPTDVAPCGQIYETAEFKSHSTRWYEDGLIIRRQVQDSVTGFWTLSPTGDGPRIDFMRDSSWNELFAVPGDITSGVATYNGGHLRVPALGVDLHETGQIRPDETTVGQFTSDYDVADDRLCALLVG